MIPKVLRAMTGFGPDCYVPPSNGYDSKPQEENTKHATVWVKCVGRRCFGPLTDDNFPVIYLD